jgi:hypothetical protein
MCHSLQIITCRFWIIQFSRLFKNMGRTWITIKKIMTPSMGDREVLKLHDSGFKITLTLFDSTDLLIRLIYPPLKTHEKNCKSRLVKKEIERWILFIILGSNVGMTSLQKHYEILSIPCHKE